MAGLWADGWFYISSAGLLVSGVLFFFLLGQYHAASEAADITESEGLTSGRALSPQAASGPPLSEQSDAAFAAIRPVFVRDEPAAAPIASIPTEPERRKDPAVTTGGLSPAVVYLQNIKGELAELHQEMRALAQRVDAELGGVAARDEALIKRLGELARVVENFKTAATVDRAPAADGGGASERAVGQGAPLPESVGQTAAPEPAADPIRLELSAVIDAQLAKKEAPVEAPPTESAAPAAAPPEPEDSSNEASSNEEKMLREKPRRGPVWPV